MPEFFNEALSRWQGMSLETQANIRVAANLFVAFVAGHILGKMATRVLAGRNFDALLRLPGSAAPTPETTPSITPTFLVGMLVRLTIWAWAAWWLCGHLGRVDAAERLGLLISRTWAVVGIVVVILALASILARRLAEALREGNPGADAAGNRYGVTTSRSGVPDAVAAGVYVLVALVVLLIAADMFDWPLTRSSAQALWQLAQKLLTVTATLGIGVLGARWARKIVSEPATSTEQRAGQYTGLATLGVALALSLGVLLSDASLLLGLATLAILGLCIWLCRGYVPDIAAGLQLRTQRVREVWFEGVAFQVAEVGFLTTQVCREGAVHSVRNRQVLDARLHGAPAELPAR